jgi:hypothetical protein
MCIIGPVQLLEGGCNTVLRLLFHKFGVVGLSGRHFGLQCRDQGLFAGWGVLREAGDHVPDFIEIFLQANDALGEHIEGKFALFEKAVAGGFDDAAVVFFFEMQLPPEVGILREFVSKKAIKLRDGPFELDTEVNDLLLDRSVCHNEGVSLHVNRTMSSGVFR